MPTKEKPESSPKKPKKPKRRRGARKGEKVGGAALKNRQSLMHEARQRAFANTFLETGSVADAAKAAGSKGKHHCGWTYLQKPLVKKIIKEETERRREKAGVTVERVLLELAAIAFSCETDYSTWGGSTVSLIPSDKLTRNQARAVQSVSSKMSAQGVPNVTLKLYDKNKALDSLMKCLGMGQENEAGKQPQATELAKRIRELVARPLAGDESKTSALKPCVGKDEPQ